MMPSLNNGKVRVNRVNKMAEKNQDENQNSSTSYSYDNLDSVWVKKDRTNFLRVGGVINFTTSLTLREEGESWIKRLGEKYKTIVFDMEPSKPNGSVCVALMLCWLRLAKKLDIQLEFHNVPQDIEKIIQLTGVSQLFNLQVLKRTPHRAYDVEH